MFMSFLQLAEIHLPVNNHCLGTLHQPTVHTKTTSKI